MVAGNWTATSICHLPLPWKWGFRKHVLIAGGIQGSQSPPTFPLALQPANWAWLPCVWPQFWGTQYVTWTAHSPERVLSYIVSLFLCLLGKGTCPDLIASLLFTLIPCKFFLQPWLYKSLSSSLPSVLSENCSACRCIFDVFMEGSGFLIFLLCHLHLSRQCCTLYSLLQPIHLELYIIFLGWGTSLSLTLS